MSGRIFVIADTHFGHANALGFKRDDGTPLRDFASVEEMDETMVARWNAVVRPQDHVYHLGDVVIAKRHLATVKRLNGHKRLVRGNHDIFRTRDYIEAGFDEIHGVRVFGANAQQGIPGAALTHVPIHPDSVPRWGLNIHGHLHSNRVMKWFADTRDPYFIPDERYICVSVEHTNYTPLALDEILRERKKPLDKPLEM